MLYITISVVFPSTVEWKLNPFIDVSKREKFFNDDSCHQNDLLLSIDITNRNIFG